MQAGPCRCSRGCGRLQSPLKSWSCGACSWCMSLSAFRFSDSLSVAALRSSSSTERRAQKRGKTTGRECCLRRRSSPRSMSSARVRRERRRGRISLAALPSSVLLVEIARFTTAGSLVSMAFALGRGSVLHEVLLELRSLRRSARVRHSTDVELYRRWRALPAPLVTALLTTPLHNVCRVLLGAVEAEGPERAVCALSRMHTICCRGSVGLRPGWMHSESVDVDDLGQAFSCDVDEGLLLDVVGPVQESVLTAIRKMRGRRTGGEQGSAELALQGCFESMICDVPRHDVLSLRFLSRHVTVTGEIEGDARLSFSFSYGTAPAVLLATQLCQNMDLTLENVKIGSPNIALILKDMSQSTSNCAPGLGFMMNEDSIDAATANSLRLLAERLRSPGGIPAIVDEVALARNREVLSYVRQEVQFLERESKERDAEEAARLLSCSEDLHDAFVVQKYTLPKVPSAWIDGVRE